MVYSELGLTALSQTAAATQIKAGGAIRQIKAKGDDDDEPRLDGDARCRRN